MKGIAAVLSVLALLGLGACKGAGKKKSAAPAVSVVTTTTLLTEWATIIGGDTVVVHGLLKPSVDAHDYEPTPADVQNIADADVVVKNGLGLEKWFDDTLENADTKAFVVDASESVIAQRADGSPAADDGHDADPHIWQNPLWARVMVHNIALAFERKDPDNADAYAQRAAAYEKKLTDLDREITAQLAPLTNRKVVTNHDAFGYYLTHYRLELVGSVIPSFDTQAELSAKDVAALVSLVKATKVKAIFAEAALPAKTAEAVAKEAGVKVVAGDDALYGDSLGPSGSEGATYIGAIRHNTEVFVDNLN